MNSDLTLQHPQLPETLDELAKFVLIGREKLTSVRAEIRAIDKLQLAQGVYDQKREEAQWLAGALLDAEARLGELFKEIPTAPGGRPSEKTMDTDVHSLRPKAEIIEGLGFNTKQAQRFETLAENKDLVEQVKQEAQENDDIPTRSCVLDLAKERNRRGQGDEQEYYDYLTECKKVALRFNNAIGNVSTLKVDQDVFVKWADVLVEDVRVSSLQRTEQALENLTIIRQFLRRKLT